MVSNSYQSDVRKTLSDDILIVETNNATETKPMTITTFTPGQTYKYRSIVTITITRRTEKSIWFEIDGKEVRRKVETIGNKIDGMYEVIRYDNLYTVRACDLVAETIEVNETIQTEVIETETTTEVIETVEINPLPQDEYESLRETLVTRFYKINDWLATEKRDRYFYVKAGGTDTDSYDVAITDYRAKLKDLDNQIKQLDAAQGIEPDPLD